jgi:hypothetical protein
LLEVLAKHRETVTLASCDTLGTAYILRSGVLRMELPDRYSQGIGA